MEFARRSRNLPGPQGATDRPWGLSAMPMLPAAVVSVACLLASIGGARAGDPQLPPAYPKPLAVGTTMVWQDADSGETKTGVVRFSDGLFHRWSWDDEETAEHQFCLNCPDTTLMNFDAYKTLWPLEVGKSVSLRREVVGSELDGPEAGYRWQYTITVIGIETLELPFGTIDTYVVLSESYPTYLLPSWRVREKYWYAPDLGLDVKYEYSATDGQSYRGHAVAITTP